MFNALTSKSVWGAIIAAVAWLLSPEVLATLPSKVSAFLGAFGGLLAVFGLRQAIAKAALGRPQ